MAEYIRIRKIDTNECPNKYLWPIRMYSWHSGLVSHHQCQSFQLTFRQKYLRSIPWSKPWTPWAIGECYLVLLVWEQHIGCARYARIGTLMWVIFLVPENFLHNNNDCLILWYCAFRCWTPKMFGENNNVKKVYHLFLCEL